MDPTSTRVMACATVMEELLPLLPLGMQHQVFDFGLHLNPDRLRRTLQDAVDSVDSNCQTIILGYGCCSQGIIGVRSSRCTLVVPRVEDCIAIFLGSRSAYRRQMEAVPGTYFLTKGWIEAGDSPFAEYERSVDRYGAERAQRIVRSMLANYKRLVLINTGQHELNRYREYARGAAARFGLDYEEIAGSTALVRKMVNGPWDGDFAVIPPGEAIRFEHFFPGTDTSEQK